MEEKQILVADARTGPWFHVTTPEGVSGWVHESLLANDVRFVGCLNTLETIERKTGTRPELIPETIFVQTGVARLVERAQQGFVVIRP